MVVERKRIQFDNRTKNSGIILKIQIIKGAILMKKYIYSPVRQEFVTARVLKENDGHPIIIADDVRGSGLHYPKMLDTGALFATHEDLVEDRYKHCLEGTLSSISMYADEEAHFYGRAWLPNEKSHTVFSSFAHEVPAPGIYHVIEWIKFENHSTLATNSDYSHPYASKDEALSNIMEHQSIRTKGQTKREINSDLGMYDLYTNGFEDEFQTHHQYRLIELNVTEEMYNSATHDVPEGYSVTIPWTHFAHPESN